MSDFRELVMIEDPGPYFVLDADRRPVPATLSAMRDFTKSDSAIVAKSQIGSDVTITTYFTGVSLGLSEEDEPLLFATVIKYGDECLDEGSYPTWEEAEAEHREAHQRMTGLAGDSDLLTWADVQSLHD
jgi:hypothetical protein